MAKKTRKTKNAPVRTQQGAARCLTVEQRDRVLNALAAFGPVFNSLSLQQFLQSIGEPAPDGTLVILFKRLQASEHFAVTAVPPTNNNPREMSMVRSPTLQPAVDSNEVSSMSLMEDASDPNAEEQQVDGSALAAVSAPFFQPLLSSDVVLELLGMLKQQAAKNAATRDDTKEVFDALCVEANGERAVNAEQVRAVATTFQLKVDVDAILRKFDTDGSGMLDLSEFRRIFDQDEVALRAAAAVLARKFNHPINDLDQRSDDNLKQEEEDLSMFLERGCQEDLAARKSIAEKRNLNVQNKQKKIISLLSPNAGLSMTQADEDDSTVRRVPRETEAAMLQAAIARDPEMWVGSGMAAATATSIEEQLEAVQRTLEKDPLRSVYARNNGSNAMGTNVEPRILGSSVALPAINSARKQQMQGKHAVQGQEMSTPRSGRGGAYDSMGGGSGSSPRKLTLPPITSPRTTRPQHQVR